MKIRTDFITNSSSGSFIFKEFDKKKVIKRIDDMAPAEKERGLSREDVLREVEWLENNLSEFKALERRTLWAIFWWYQKELLDDILQIDTGNEYNRWKKIENAWKEQVLPNKEMSTEQRKRWNAYLIWHLCERYLLACAVEGRTADRVESLSELFLDEMLNSYVVTSWDEWPYEYILRNYESMKQELMPFVGMHPGEILSVAFDATCVYYVDEGYGMYPFVQLFKKSGICNFACGHMG